MKRSDVVEMVSTLSVVIGLVFVGLQLHQNTTVQRVTATQVLSAAYSDALEFLSYEEEAACVYVLGINGLANLDDAQRLRFFSMWLRLFRAAEQLQYYAYPGHGGTRDLGGLRTPAEGAGEPSRGSGMVAAPADLVQRSVSELHQHADQGWTDRGAAEVPEYDVFIRALTRRIIFAAAFRFLTQGQPMTLDGSLPVMAYGFAAAVIIQAATVIRSVSRDVPPLNKVRSCESV
jgi:hypothetical protein